MVFGIHGQSGMPVTSRVAVEGEGDTGHAMVLFTLVWTARDHQSNRRIATCTNVPVRIQSQSPKTDFRIIVHTKRGYNSV